MRIFSEMLKDICVIKCEISVIIYVICMVFVFRWKFIFCEYYWERNGL